MLGMRVANEYLAGLSRLHGIADRNERLATWRESMATLAAAVQNRRNWVPLEGISPEDLRRSVGKARKDGLIEELDWLSGPSAAAALYELASALPPGEEKRNIGRVVYQRLMGGDAETFVALATQLALSAGRALSGPGIRARVALSLQLPFGSGVYVGDLALALISRRELRQTWLMDPSAGSLPERRMAGRLLEHAAREAVRRAHSGDRSGLQPFETDDVRLVWETLLADREALVWRHVSVARGLLSCAMPALGNQIDEELGPEFGITEWRRAATSLAATITFQPDRGLDRCIYVLQTESFLRDEGIAAAMVAGLGHAAETQREATEQLLEELAHVGGLAATEQLVELRRSAYGNSFASRATRFCRALLFGTEKGSRYQNDDGFAGLQTAIIEAMGEEQIDSLTAMADAAVLKFATHDANVAFEEIEGLVHRASATIDAIEAADLATRESRIESYCLLRDIDQALLQSDVVINLLQLGASGAHTKTLRTQLSVLFERLNNWLALQIGEETSEEGQIEHFFFRLQHLQGMLHLVDADGDHVSSDPEHLRNRRYLALRVIAERLRRESLESRLRRALCATLSRGVDALLREEDIDLSDALLLAMEHAGQWKDFATLSEASMVPELTRSFHSLADFASTVERHPDDRTFIQESLSTFAHELPVATSPRIEALRRTCFDLLHSLTEFHAAHSLRDLVTPIEALWAEGMSVMETLCESLSALTRLCQGTRFRVSLVHEYHALPLETILDSLRANIDRLLNGRRDGDLTALCGDVITEIHRAIPETFAMPVCHAIALLPKLPINRGANEMPSRQSPAAGHRAPLPGWVPPDRTLGGFYVKRAIGVGAVGSVFVATRYADRTKPDAEEFALKVPDYSGPAARTLSEEEFHRLFREEASALLSLPEHPNLAHFVTFDARAKPKPVLVMELVRGPTLERQLQSGSITTARAIDAALGVARGLDSMHRHGVGHLDVKPSNVILRRDPHTGNTVPVLVDFGLAGRRIRPGCGTAEYGAPEIWGLLSGDETHAIPADIYAFACLLFEVLTGKALFQGNNPMAMITLHATHDGIPERLRPWFQWPLGKEIARLISSMLRQKPKDRMPLSDVIPHLEDLRSSLVMVDWPLPMQIED